MKNLLSLTVTFAAGTFLCAGLATSILSESAFAEPQAGENLKFSFPFNYSANELTSAKGADRVVSRLEHAVRRECGGYEKGAMNQRDAIEACVNATMKASIGKFGSPAVAQAYQTRTEG